MINHSLTMTPKNPRWKEFCDQLEVFADSCDSSHDKPGARAVLSFMGMNVEESLAYFEKHGGYCDCEILMNVAYS